MRVLVDWWCLAIDPNTNPVDRDQRDWIDHSSPQDCCEHTIYVDVCGVYVIESDIHLIWSWQRSKVVTAFDSNVSITSDIKSLRGRRFESCRCRFFYFCPWTRLFHTVDPCWVSFLLIENQMDGFLKGHWGRGMPVCLLHVVLFPSRAILEETCPRSKYHSWIDRL